MQRYLALVGRTMMGIFFVTYAWAKLMNFWQITTSWPPLFHLPLSIYLPLADVLLALTILVTLVGGTTLILGYRTKSTALVLASYLIVNTAAYHMGYTLGSPQGDFAERFFMIGALLLLSGIETPELSFDAYLGGERFRRTLPSPSSHRPSPAHREPVEAGSQYRP